MALHPVGPLPASTYWRRRAVLLLVLVVLALVARSCASDGGDSGTKASLSGAPTSTASASPPTATPPAGRPAATKPPAPVRTCSDADLTLTTDTDADTYALGASPRITLTLTNTSAVPCRRDLGAAAVELLVFSGADRIWSSDDCGNTGGKALTTLPAGGSQTVVKTWAGTRSKPDCAGSKAQAQPGTYRVTGRVGTLRVPGAVFRFRD